MTQSSTRDSSLQVDPDELVPMLVELAAQVLGAPA
jgi:hypothetical protein